MVDIDRSEGGEFVWPEKKKWGLEPDEQVALFGNPKEIDKYDIEAFLVMQEKIRLTAKYLASFIPEDTVPDAWKERYDAALQREEQFHQEQRVAGIIFPETPQEFMMLEGMTSHKTAFDRLAVRAALDRSASDDSTPEARKREQYITALLDEYDNHSYRGDRGGPTWSVLPAAPWNVAADTYPLGDVLNKAEFGLDWQKKGKELFEPKEAQWGLTPDEQRLLFCDSLESARLKGEERLNLQQMKAELAIKYFAYFLPNNPEWADRLLEIRALDARRATELVISNPDKAMTITIGPVRETAIRRDVGEFGVPSGERKDALCEGAFAAAFEKSRGSESDPDAVLRGDYAYDLIKGALPKAPFRVLSQDYPALPIKPNIH